MYVKGDCGAVKLRENKYKMIKKDTGI
jgi:hypothetical protein